MGETGFKGLSARKVLVYWLHPLYNRGSRNCSHLSLGVSWNVLQPVKSLSLTSDFYSSRLLKVSWTDTPNLKLSWFICLLWLSCFPGSVRPAHKCKEMMYVNYHVHSRGSGEKEEERHMSFFFSFFIWRMWIQFVQIPIVISFFFQLSLFNK